MPTIYKEKTNEKASFRYLSVAKCSQITDQGLHQVQLRIHNFSKLKPLQVSTLCYKLRYLNLRGCHLITDIR